MGIDSRRPPLPAPTDDFTTSMDDSSALGTEVATNVTTRTDKTSYSIPEDGSPITISTHKLTPGKEGRLGRHGRQKSQTSLLIEYFEGAKTGDKSRSRPSVRVKVTPSSRKSKGHDAVQITGIGSDRKPSYTRRISLTNSSKNVEVGGGPLDATEVSHSSESNISGRHPIEIEVLNHNSSDMSAGARSSRGLLHAHEESNVSSMPPDSLLEGDSLLESERSFDPDHSLLESERSLDPGHEGEGTITETEYLKAPTRRRSRSTSRERITQKVMEKLGQAPVRTRKSSRPKSERSISQEYEGHERRRRSSKHHLDDDTVSGAESSLLSSNIAPSQRSYRTSTSQGSRMTNNPKLLEMVEDTIKRMILPEINAIKEDQKTDRKLRTFEESRRGSLPYSEYESGGLQRRVSKSSSTPNISSRPKVVLNRDGDDPGVTLSRGDSEYRKVRKHSTDRPSSSRRSSGRHSIGSDRSDRYEEEEFERPRSSSKKSGHGLRNTAAAGIAGGILTAAALKHHNSQDDVSEKRKRRSKSRSERSRSNSIADSRSEAYTRKEDIPPMPMASRINDSEVTRDSILSADTEMSPSKESGGFHMPIREVSRGSVDASMSPTSSRTPTRTPVGKGLGMSHGNQSIESPSSRSNKERIAALAAAGLGAAALEHRHDQHVEADGYGSLTPKHNRLGSTSPAQSVSSLRHKYEDPLIPSALRPQSAASRSSANRSLLERESKNSLGSSPTTTRLASRKHSANISHDEFTTPLERPESDLMRDYDSRSGTHTPNGGESIEEWYERQHLANERYRDSMDSPANRASYMTNPYPEDEKRFSTYTQESRDDSLREPNMVERNVQGVGANAEIVDTPTGVESAVASLMEPSSLSSGRPVSSIESDTKTKASYSDRMAEHLRTSGKDDLPAVYEGSTMSQNMPSSDRWAAIMGRAQTLSSGSKSQEDITEEVLNSPRQSEARSFREERLSTQSPVKLGANSIPNAHDPMPEIGHFDDSKSDVTTNPSIIQGPLGGDVTGKSAWPYTPSPPRSAHSEQHSTKGGLGREAALLGAAAGGAAAVLAANHAASHAARQPSFHDEEEYEDGGKLTPDVKRYRGEKFGREATPTSPAALRDEGYVTDARETSAGAVTPKADQRRYDSKGLDSYHKAMDAQDLAEDDVFSTDSKHARHISANSHGMESPLYDHATGEGIDRIQSKDVVALMDHLTVRDAQRNARDTEILVTLVRSASEMRGYFDDLKRFIAEQDKMIMSNNDRNADQTVQRVLGGPRPFPGSSASPRTPRGQSEEDIQKKRKGVLRRALKGLTGGKSANDLTKIEDMFMQILDNVEDLKHQGYNDGGRRQSVAQSQYTDDNMDSYEKLRAVPDSGYEPEGRDGTDSTPSHSGNLSIDRRDKQQFHSGYNGRPGSVNRVSTVMEGDEDDEYLEPHERRVLNNQFEHNERLVSPIQDLTPTQSPTRNVGAYSSAQAHELTPRTADRQAKHRSTGSSINAGTMPKDSRWSKTTSSSAAPDVTSADSPNIARGPRPLSTATSTSSKSLARSEGGRYELQHEDRRRSTQSLAREEERKAQMTAETRSIRSQASRLTRTPSPLIPSETSQDRREYDDDDYYSHRDAASPRQEDDEEYDPEFDDPKYQAHRNSLPLQHPQPRQGPTNRHQNTLESQAQTQNYGDVSTTSSDLSQRTVSDFDPAMWGSSGAGALGKHRFVQPEPLSPVSMGSPGANKKDEGPLVPRSSKSQSQPQSQQPPAGFKYANNNDYDDDEDDYDEPQYSNSGFAKSGGRMYYTSPLGSGHLLEPIQEVRYSLETDSGHISPEPEISNARAVDIRSAAGQQGRKITGPRPMSAHSHGSPSGSGNSYSPAGANAAKGTIRRKPVRGSRASNESFESETF